MASLQDSDSERLERIERLVERIANEQAEMKADMGVMQRDMGVMKGWQTELAVERRARSVFRRLCGGHLLRIFPDMDLQHYIGSNRNAGNISTAEANRAETIDFLLEGTDSNGTPVVFAVEVSYNIGVEIPAATEPISASATLLANGQLDILKLSFMELLRAGRNCSSGQLHCAGGGLTDWCVVPVNVAYGVHKQREHDRQLRLFYHRAIRPRNARPRSGA